MELPNMQEKTLSWIDHPLAKMLLKYKRVSTMLSNYGSDGLRELPRGRGARAALGNAVRGVLPVC